MAIKYNALGLAWMMAISPIAASAQEADPNLAPAQYFEQAADAYRKGDMEQATFLLYVGQLRYRACR